MGIMLQREPKSNGNPKDWIIEPKYAGYLTVLYNPV